MRAGKSVAAVLFTAAVAAGCAESSGQHSARLAVQRAAAADRRAGDTHCTSNPRLFFTEAATAKVFVCLVKVGSGLCDRYLVRRIDRRLDVRLQERDADCILPTA
jgi:hypothetical protein